MTVPSYVATRMVQTTEVETCVHHQAALLFWQNRSKSKEKITGCGGEFTVLLFSLALNMKRILQIAFGYGYQERTKIVTK